MNTGPPGKKGQEEEARACAYLQSRGLVLRERNYRCRYGEIDLIMDEGDTLVFVEVRSRAPSRYASAAESVDRRKQAKLTATALHYLQAHHNVTRRPSRFDVVTIVPGAELRQFDWIKNAFYAE